MNYNQIEHENVNVVAKCTGLKNAKNNVNQTGIIFVSEYCQQPNGNLIIEFNINSDSPPIKHIGDYEYHQTKYVHNKGENNITLRDAIENYISTRNNTLSPSTIRGYRIIQNHRFQSVMDKGLKDIADWQKLCNVEAKYYSGKTIKNSYLLISSVLAENGISLPKITLPQIVSEEHPWLDYEQIMTFVRDVHGKECEIPALLALHSLRRSEICALDWGKNIDLKNEHIIVKGALVSDENNKFVRKEANKNESSRRVVPIMIPELLSALKDVEDKTGAIVKCNPNTIWRRVNRVCEKNGLPRVGVHGLRHSFASLAYHLQMPEEECMRLGGWADSKTMHKIYLHLADMDINKHKNKMSEFYKNANGISIENIKSNIINAYEV